MRYDMNDFENEEQKNKYVSEMMDSIRDDYEYYEKQRAIRSERRLAEEARRDKRKRFVAIATAAVLALGTGAYILKDKLPGAGKDEPIEPQTTSLYDEYVDYVNEQRELGFEDITISQEGYQEYVETYGDNLGKGSR